MSYLLFLVLTPFAALALSAAAFTVWQYRGTRSAVLLLTYFALVGALLLGNTFELLAAESRATLFWATAQTMVFAFIPPVWLGFALSYAQPQRRLGLPWAAGLSVVPSLTAALVLTNAFHGLYWRSVEFIELGSWLSMRGTYGMWFWVHGAYSYLLLLSGSALIVYAAVASPGSYARQARWLILGALTPLAFNLIYVFRVFPFLPKDFTPLGFAAAGVFFYIGLRWFNLFRLRPIARSIVYNDLQPALVTLDTSAQVVDYNYAAAVLLGLEESCLGQPFTSIPSAAPVLGSRSPHHAASFDSSGTYASHHRELEVQLIPLSEARRNAVGMLLMITDVTSSRALIRERDKAVEKLTANNARLEAAQAQLLKQERMATIGALAAELAHEVNNPLTILRSSTAALLKGKPGLSSEISSDIEIALGRISEVTRSLVRLTRPTQAKPDSVRIEELMERALIITRPTYGKHMRIERCYALSTGPVECFSEDIVQVLINIIINAAQAYTGADGVITLSTAALPDSSGVRCCIENNGPDIPPELRRRVFEPFVTSKADTGGTGLGLSSAKHLIEGRHGGRIYLEAGMPVRFIIELPSKVMGKGIEL